jgi:hypothetical protein
VPADLEEGKQIIELCGGAAVSTLYFPERTRHPFKLRLPCGHA